ncbi:carboxypeptidase-like regulatory domain-containing protein [uncultured Paludibaculum sp.]|uniref:carboxypeptidase-like regulatory domain-containing protein n=1 Tax=uncultured Paludibaculum sp. TaxID=1765020 RepID=UPI002AAB0EB3|nr:carboxypeptidase-like regulatory domain-containing protein [uncultured Paludibaculum sp.]
MARIVIWVTAAVCCPLVFAQSNLATVNGIISDPHQDAVLNAVVQARNDETCVIRSVTTGSTGRYEIPGLVPGPYTIEAQASGFSTATHPIRLEVGQNMRLDLGLTVGPAKTSLEVTSTVEMLKTQDAAVGEVVETKSVKELPLNGRALLDLALTVPGSHQGHGTYVPGRTCADGLNEPALLASGPKLFADDRRQPPQRELLPH